MANRLTDSRKWDDPWFRKLPCKYKVFYMFIVDKCDHAGFWKVDFESAEFFIGEKINPEEILTLLDGRIQDYGDEWFIPKFIEFQYKVSMDKLDPNNKVHKSVIEILKNKGLTSPLRGSKDKEKDKNKDKDKDNNDRFGFTPSKKDVEEIIKKVENATTITKNHNK